jgi:hypothetical protein
MKRIRDDIMKMFQMNGAESSKFTEIVQISLVSEKY